MNPFIIKGYAGPEYFCNRESETGRILNAIENQRNLTLISLRKMGKTGLIYHVFHHLDEERYDSIYLDIFDTNNLTGFINKLASAILSFRKTFHDRLMEYIGAFRYIRPAISADPFTGLPTASFKISSEEEAQQTIGDLFRILEDKSMTRPIVLAIDEFQQITKYPEKNVEATLRSYIQHLQNVTVIFSGSNRSLLGQIFSNPARPFYQSTELMFLEEIVKSDYILFIKKIFSTNRVEIDELLIAKLVDWAKVHTHYVQFCCNRLIERKFSPVTEKVLSDVFHQILLDHEPFYFEFRNLLTQHQWQLLKAIAKENGVKNITSLNFIKQYGLSSASTVKRGIDSLLEKELIYKNKDHYYILDVFFSRWLELQD
jgi:hypothetical protein